MSNRKGPTNVRGKFLDGMNRHNKERNSKTVIATAFGIATGRVAWDGSPRNRQERRIEKAKAR